MLHFSTCPQLKRGKILINRESQMDLQKYAFSNALALSGVVIIVLKGDLYSNIILYFNEYNFAVKLGIWENTMDQFVENLEDIIEVITF